MQRPALLGALVAFLLAAPAFASPLRLAQGWREYSPRERYNALQNYRHYQALPNERRENVERNYQKWQAMPEQERERMRQNFQRYQQLPPEQRSRLRQRYQAPPKH
ncbi:MAG TPA: DUF3106 domain-containing protein [Pseudomonadales bacterium]|nr:DUF3106 domain-containing protein [Pseudomonadales bacterium]